MVVPSKAGGYGVFFFFYGYGKETEYGDGLVVDSAPEVDEDEEQHPEQ